jgi:hypothetical protein
LIVPNAKSVMKVEKNEMQKAKKKSGKIENIQIPRR